MIIETIINIHAGAGLILIFALLRAMHNGICTRKISEGFLYRTAFFLIGFRLAQILAPPAFQESASVLFDLYLIGCTWLLTKRTPEKQKSNNGKNIIL